VLTERSSSVMGHIFLAMDVNTCEEV